MDNNNLFSIGEVAEAIGITRKIILNYEAKGLVKPDKKDGETGNRYYTIDTFTHIRTIRTFQNLGLSLDEIRGYFNEDFDLNPIIKKLEKMRDELNLTIEKLCERVSSSSEVIKKITIEPQTIYHRTYNAVTIEDRTNLLRDTALEAMKLYGTDTTRRMYFTEHPVKTPNDITYCVAVPKNSEGENVSQLPAVEAISTFHHGPYELIQDTRKKLTKYAKKNNIELAGVFRNIYLEGPPQHKDSSRYITPVIAIIK